MISKTTLVFYKHIPAERYAAYKDRHRPIHARNIEVIKKRMKVEKRTREREVVTHTQKEITRERKIEKEYAISRHRLLNII